MNIYEDGFWEEFISFISKNSEIKRKSQFALIFKWCSVLRNKALSFVGFQEKYQCIKASFFGYKSIVLVMAIKEINIDNYVVI